METVTQLTLDDLEVFETELFFLTDEQPGKRRTARKNAELLTGSYMFLDLRPGRGNLFGPFWETNSPYLGDYCDLNTGPAPYYGSACSQLSEILEQYPDEKYNLSKTACLGILRRSLVRGKELPLQLRQALMAQADIHSEEELYVALPELAALRDANEDGGCLTPWDVQSRRVYKDNGVWPSLYGSEGGGRGYISAFHINQRDELIDLNDVSGALMATRNMQTQAFISHSEEKTEGSDGDGDIVAFACNQRDEVRDLGTCSGAIQAQPGMKQQTFVRQQTAIPVNMQIATRSNKTGEGTGFGVGNDGEPAYTLQEAHSHGVFTATGEQTHASGIVAKGNGDCFLTPETHTSLTSGGGQAGQGYPCVMTAGFCAGAAPSAGGIGYQEECAPTMKAGGSGTNMVPTVICLNDQGGQVMEVCENITGTLRAQTHGHLPLVMEKPSDVICLNDQGGQRMDVYENMTGTLRAQMDGHPPLVLEQKNDCCETSGGINPGNAGTMLFENHGIDSRYKGPPDVAPTISARWGTGGNNTPLLSGPQAFSLDSAESNSMKSKNPHSGCRKTDVARTIDTTYPDPSKNQGGIAIVQETYCIAGNIIDREAQNGGNGFGYQPDISYTLNTCDKHAIFSRQRSDLFKPNEVVSTQNARQCKDATDLVLDTAGLDCRNNTENGNLCGTLQSKSTGGYSLNNVHPVRTGNLIRRLTPLECERLMGVPDGWTAVGDGSDSARYKALGNSVAIPCVDFVMRGIAYFCRQSKGDTKE